MARDLLLEIGTEEMPAAAVKSGLVQLKEIAEKTFQDNRLSYSSIKTMATPRRLVLLTSSLREEQEPLITAVKGPPKELAYSSQGKPNEKATGFARSQGVEVSDLKVRTTPQGEYVFAEKKERGKASFEILPKILPSLILSLSFSKQMRWGQGKLKFVRPIRWILALYGRDLVKFPLDGLRSGRKTRGHRLFQSSPIEAKNVTEYFSILEEKKIMIDPKARAEEIRRQAEEVARELGGEVVFHPKTFEEVVNLVEYPQAISGSFPRDYLALPREVLEVAMETHQRYFPVEDGEGNLLPHFVVVHNGRRNYKEIIRRGNERVLKACLADAKFFFEEDRKRKLEQRVPQLKGVVFQEKLGTVYDKTQRIKKLASLLIKELGWEKQEKEGERAALLAKTDLVTEMVTEYPVLQGIVGGIYAKLDGESPEVAQGIFEHYLPRYAEDKLPSSKIGQIVSLADKLETVIGCFSVGLIPTSSGDPYALRRRAQGIVRIILEKNLHISFLELVSEGYKLLKKDKIKVEPPREVFPKIEEFFRSRLRKQFSKEGFNYDLINSVLYNSQSLDDFADLKRRLITLAELRNTEPLQDVLIAFNRCHNLANSKVGSKVDRNLLQETEEQALYDKISKVEGELDKVLTEKKYKKAIKLLSTTRKEIDNLFDEVLVMSEDKNLRDNRLALLNRCVEIYLKVANFSEIVS